MNLVPAFFVQLGAGALDPVLGVLWWWLAGPQCDVRGGRQPWTVLRGGEVEVHPLPWTCDPTDLQHLLLPTMGGHGMVSGQ